ncbi:S41 family peptidase [Rufibacter roseus]|uniref:S41 family peptidase n=1 Tax=Rufibacter roseus TaxID=1567108 RepID=A0ABW2DJ09_9BACT|nr:S41 family peptidase [Rufibacter roseus]
MKSLKIILILIALAAVIAPSYGQQQNSKVENVAAFAKLYGYVRYFHPSDEAAAVDWDRFAIYGTQKVESSRTPQELQATLTSLFQPIAPTVKVLLEAEENNFSKQQLIPANSKKFKTVAWQHQGLGFGDKRSPYRSTRTNRPVIYKEASAGFGSVVKQFDATGYQGKDFILKGRIKLDGQASGSGHLWARIDKADKTMGFFDNMGDRPVTSGTWAYYEIKGKIDAGAEKINVGAMLIGFGQMSLDDFSLQINDNGTWKEIFVEQFTQDKNGKAPASFAAGISKNSSSGKSNYSYTVHQEKDNKWLHIKSQTASSGKEHKPQLLFPTHPQIGEYVQKSIGGGLKVVVPLALYGTEEQTYPAADQTAFTALQNKLKAIPFSDLNGSNLYTRLGDVTIAWNIFQHFYPYFDIAKTNWQQELHDALTKAYSDKTAVDFQQTLQLLTAKLQDGHVGVGQPANKANYQPPFLWEWVENKLVITGVLAPSLPFAKGDIVTQINGESPEDYFAEVHRYISAATPGWRNYRAQSASLLGEKDSEFSLTVLKADNSSVQANVKRTLSRSQAFSALPKPDTIKTIADGIMYINLDAAPMAAIDKAMPQLQKSKIIICDLRGYPKGNHELISYLLTSRDTSSQWMQVPQYIYPDQENLVGYKKHSWLIKPKTPHLTAKIIFLTDGSAISYAESYMGMIDHYNLATVIGQPTAGTNGNVNPFSLPGGYSISWTGMKVLKHDGSQHHGVGIIPDVLVEKTIKGVREGRDEFLEKALEIAQTF